MWKMMKGFFNLKPVICLWILLVCSLPPVVSQPLPALSSPLEREQTPDNHQKRGIHEILFQANQAYLEGQYESAAKGYESLVDKGHMNGHVFYNLGNCYIRLNQIGLAILNYKKAQLLLPRDEDLRANLKYARSLTQDRLETTDTSLWRTLAFWYFSMNFQQLLFAGCLLFILFWISALIKLYRDSEAIKWLLALSLLLSVVMTISTGLKMNESLSSTKGVILSQEAPIRAGFSRNDTTLFILHEGAEFSVLDQKKDWWKIALPDGKKGWLPSESGGLISLNRSTH